MLLCMRRYGIGIYCQLGPNLQKERIVATIYPSGRTNKNGTKLKEYKMELIVVGTHFSSLRWYWTWVGWALAQDVITVLTLLKSANTYLKPATSGLPRNYCLKFLEDFNWHKLAYFLQ
jgi:hypothetical protein